MNYFIIGFFTGLSLILVIGAQNIFVIEQGIKKQYIFLVCLICSVSDLILIFFGIYLFEYFVDFFNYKVELIFNILLLLFLLYFIINKIIIFNKKIDFILSKNNFLLKEVIFKCLGFTFLNPHVFFLGNFSKNLVISDKIFFGIGASIASFLFFFILGYLSKYLSKYLYSQLTWKLINFFIIIFMSGLSLYVVRDIISY